MRERLEVLVCIVKVGLFPHHIRLGSHSSDHRVPSSTEVLVNHEQCLTTPSMCTRLDLLLLEDVKLSREITLTNVRERLHQLCVQGDELSRVLKCFNGLVSLEDFLNPVKGNIRFRRSCNYGIHDPNSPLPIVLRFRKLRNHDPIRLFGLVVSRRLSFAQCFPNTLRKRGFRQRLSRGTW